MKNGRLDCSRGFLHRLHNLVSIVVYAGLLICAALLGEAIAAACYEYRMSSGLPYEDAASACQTWYVSGSNSLQDQGHTMHGPYRDASDDPEVDPWRGCQWEHTNGNNFFAAFSSIIGDEVCEVIECEADALVYTGSFDGVTSQSTCRAGCVVETRGMSFQLGPGSEHDDRYGDWYETGDMCEAGEPEPGSSDLPIVDAEGNIVDVVDFASQCGTFNGVAICAESIPAGGKCIFDGAGGYSCANRGEQNVVPEHDSSSETVEVTAGPQTWEWSESTGEFTKVTVSQGTVSAGSDLESGSGDPEAGGPGSGIEGDGSGEGEGEEEGPTHCEENPELCDFSWEDPSDDPALPTDETDLELLLNENSYTTTLAENESCPEPYTLSLPSELGGASIDVEYTGFCDLATALRPLVIALAYLASFFFFIRSLK